MAGPEARAGGQPANAGVLQAARHGRPADVGVRTLLPAVADAFFGGELARVQRRRDVRAIAPAASDFPVHAGADFEPGRRDDDRVDERPLDAVVDRRLVPLVDDADGHQHHAGAHVEAARQQEVDVGLLELQLARLFEPLDERVFELELADEPDAIAEAVGDEQHEAMEVEAAVLEFGLLKWKSM